MPEAELEIVTRARDEASKQLGLLHNVIGGLSGAATAPLHAIGGLTKALGAVGLAGMGIKTLVSGVTSLAQGMVSGNAEFERYETQFGVLLGSSEKAKQRLEELAEFGAKTPFDLPEVVRADKVLTAFGLDSETTARKFGVSAQQIRTTIGDVAAGTGASFEQLSLTFGKFASGATGEAIARFQEMGIATREEMASWGLEFSKSGQLLTPAAEAFTVLEEHVRAKFGGMMDAQSSTFEGMLSNLSDWMGNAKRTLMAPLFEVLKDKLGGLLEFLGSPTVMNTLNGLAQTFADKLGGAISTVEGLIGDLEGTFTNVMSVVDRARSKFDDLTSTFGTFGQYGAVPGIIDNVRSKLSGLLGPLAPVGDALGKVLDGVRGLTGMVGLMNPLDNLLKGDLKGALHDVMAPVQNWGPMIAEAATGLMDQLNTLRDQIVGQLAEWGSAFVEWIVPMIPDLLAGLGDIALKVVTWILDQREAYYERLMTWAAAFVDWVAPMIPKLLAQLLKVASSLLGWIKDQAPKIIDKMLGEWLPAALSWVVSLAQKIVPEMLNVATQLLDFITQEGPSLAEKFLSEWLPAAIEWVARAAIDIIPKLLALVIQIGTWIITTGVPKLVEFAVKMGSAIVGGLLKGLTGLGAKLLEAIIAELRKVNVDLGPLGMVDFGQMLPAYTAPIAGYAEGGIVPGPRGAPRLAMVHGGETITPAGGGGNVIIYLTVQGSVVSEQDLIATVRRGLLMAKSRNYSLGMA